MTENFYIGYAIMLGVMCFLSFVLYGVDKFKAKKNLWRIKESVLLLFGFLGGALGALLAMYLFRHKTRHWYFWAVNILGLLWQIALPVFAFIGYM
ncbi:MAG: DUF1294 domain-containing protein [Clostridia bacterium]|nr:DUF1294 domain-containing protein [Clostridia bacterium]